MHPNDGRVVSNFIVQALLGRDITIYGEGSQTRSFCYVDDLIDGFIRLMKSPGDVTGPINLGNPTEFTILQLASQVIDFVGSRSRIVHRPLPQDDPRQRQPNISRARKILDWSPRTPLAEGLKRTIELFRGTPTGSSHCASNYLVLLLALPRPRLEAVRSQSPCSLQWESVPEAASWPPQIASCSGIEKRNCGSA